MNINSISIVGLGLIGGSLARAIKHNFPNIVIYGFDKPGTLETAEGLGVIDFKIDNPLEAIKADLIFLCLPVDYAIKVFQEIIPLLSEKQIISDVCSVKGIFTDIWKDVAPKGQYIGGHPMTGKEKGGFDNSDPLLFENSVYILTDKSNAEFVGILKQIGARITFLDPYTHDKVVSTVSHLPQLISISLVNFATLTENNIRYIDFSAGGFRDMTRIASSGYDIWDSIIANNRKNITYALDGFIDELIRLHGLLKHGYSEEVKELFEKARTTRDEIPKTSKGFLFPLHEIYVYVKDEPGVVSKISTVLYSNGINIKDIELLKIREGTGGTFRLSFETEDDAINANKLIQNLGFNTK